MFADFTFALRIKRFEEFSEVENFLFRQKRKKFFLKQ